MRLSFVAIFLSHVDCMRFNQLLLQRRAMLHGLATMPLAAQASDFVPAPGSLADMLSRARGDDQKEKAPAAERDEPYDNFVMAPTNDLLFVLNAQYQLNEVASKLSRPGYSANDDDRTAVLQLIGFSFRPTAALLHEMTQRYGAFRALRRPERTKGVELAAQFGADLAAVQQSCRDRAPPADQAAALRAASATLGEFLALSATKWETPKLPSDGVSSPLL